MPIKNVSEYIEKHPKWSEELHLLKDMLESTRLEPSIKWGGPVYTINGKNVVGFAAFKNHCSLWFFNGALLKENTALLINAQEGKTRALRQIKFQKEDRINTDVLIRYVQEAIQNQLEGKEIKARSSKKELVIPQELKLAFSEDANLKKAFEGLTPGRQREYAEYIAEAKREDTKLKRIEKITPMVKDGKGLNDKYKNC